MRSSRNGRSTFPVSVGAIDERGFWLLLGARRVVVSFRSFPWFREFTVRELAGVTRPSENHIRWPEFDIDLEVESLMRPSKYPLTEKRLRGEPAQIVRRLRATRRRNAVAQPGFASSVELRLPAAPWRSWR